MRSKKEIILRYLSKPLLPVFERFSEQEFEEFREIRLRVNLPILCRDKQGERFLDFTPSGEIISECLQLMSNYSLYAFSDYMCKGFITLPGGHRVGIAGHCVVENGVVKMIRDVSSLNIRLSTEMIGVAEGLAEEILPPVDHTLIISPPGFGKTTLLRDLIRVISDGRKGYIDGLTVGVVDERSEIAGCYCGVPQNYLGQRTDVLDGVPKSQGMLMLLRSMSPQVIAVDELGGAEDYEAVSHIINAGVKLICTVHGQNLDEVSKSMNDELLGIFKHIIVLSGVGKYNVLEG